VAESLLRRDGSGIVFEKVKMKKEGDDNVRSNDA